MINLLAKTQTMQIEYLGNKELLSAQKTAFFCSRTVSGNAVLRCLDWATEMARQGVTVIGSFQSKIERDVLHFLLRGKQPIIIVLARRMYKVLPEELQKPLSEGRLLIVSTAPRAVRVSKAYANERNSFIARIADNIVFGYIDEGSNLQQLCNEYENKATILSPKT